MSAHLHRKDLIYCYLFGSKNSHFSRCVSWCISLGCRYVLISRPTEWTDQLRDKYLEGFDAFLELLKCMQVTTNLILRLCVSDIWNRALKQLCVSSLQGMDPVVRQVGQHIEMEPEWEAAFTLQMKLTHIISMMQEWCGSDVSAC